jgi:hypothetical protein
VPDVHGTLHVDLIDPPIHFAELAAVGEEERPTRGYTQRRVKC